MSPDPKDGPLLSYRGICKGTAMPIQFYCPNCGDFLEVDDNLEGQQGECPACGTLITVPLENVPPKNLSESDAVSENPFESPKSHDLPESDFVNPDIAVRSPFQVKEVLQIILRFYRSHFLSIFFVGFILLLVNFDTFFDLYGLQSASDVAVNSPSSSEEVIKASSSSTGDLSSAEIVGKFLPQKNAFLFYLLIFLKYYIMLWAVKKIIALFKNSERDRLYGIGIRPVGFKEDQVQNVSRCSKADENGSKCSKADENGLDLHVEEAQTDQSLSAEKKRRSIPDIREYLCLLGGNFIFSAVVFLLALIGTIFLAPVVRLSQSENALLALPGILITFFILFFICRLCFSLSFYPFFIIEQKEGVFRSLKSSWYFAANRPDVTRSLSLFFFLLGGTGLFFVLLLTLLGSLADSFFVAGSSLGEDFSFVACNTLIYAVFLPFFFVLFSVIYLKMTGRLIRKQ